jgi:hypothetical protein
MEQWNRQGICPCLISIQSLSKKEFNDEKTIGFYADGPGSGRQSFCGRAEG